MVSFNYAHEYPTTRQDALRVGTMLYRTGKPCTRGHEAPRYASNAGCVSVAVKAGPRRSLTQSRRICRST